MGKPELFDIAARIVVETKAAWKIDDGTRQEWIPKSQAQDNEDGTFTMPLWLAKEKGFV